MFSLSDCYLESYPRATTIPYNPQEHNWFGTIPVMLPEMRRMNTKLETQ